MWQILFKLFFVNKIISWIFVNAVLRFKTRKAQLLVCGLLFYGYLLLYSSFL